MKFGDQAERPLTFNLARPIEQLDSAETPGLQLADVLCSSIGYALKNPHNPTSKTWLKVANEVLGGPRILPDHRETDLRSRKPFVNAAILRELVDRTVKGKSMFTDMPDFIRGASMLFDRMHLRTPENPEGSH